MLDNLGIHNNIYLVPFFGNPTGYAFPGVKATNAFGRDVVNCFIR
jgi:hypothetical protein